MLVIVGYLFLALGLLSTLPLLLGPFGLFGLTPAPAAWVSYPFFMVVGFLLSALGSAPKGIGMMFRTVGALLLALGCAAGLGLVAGATGVAALQHNTLSLYYLLLTGLVFGVLGLVATRAANPGTEKLAGTGAGRESHPAE